jgi:hypothetical protein
MKCKLGDEGHKVSWDFLFSMKGDDVSACYLVAQVVPLIGSMWGGVGSTILQDANMYLKHVTGCAVGCWFDVGRHSSCRPRSVPK